MVLLLAWSSLVLLGDVPEASGFDTQSTAGAHDITYHYFPTSSWQFLDSDLSDPAGTSGIYRSRTYNARQEWNTATDAISIVYGSSSTNLVGWKYIGTSSGLASTPCDGSDCTLYLSRAAYWDQEWNPYTSEPGISPVTGKRQIDAYGTLVHEMGHWLGLGHGADDGCQVSGGVTALYSPAPTDDMVTMCFDPGVAGVNASEQRTPSQDDFQGVNDIHRLHTYVRGWFTANAGLSEGCTAWDETPSYWMFMKHGSGVTQDASHWCGNGVVSLNNNSSVPYPELVQRARGADVDANNNGRFRIRARVMARHPYVTPRAVAFVRNFQHAYEDSCNPWPSGMPLNQWRILDCELVLDSSASSWLGYEYGVRVTEKIDIDWIEIRDL